MAAERITTTYQRIPQKIRFYVITLLFALLTAFSASHYPLSILPEYKVGDFAGSDITVPVDLLGKDNAHPEDSQSLFKHNPLLLSVGEPVTEEKLRLIQIVRDYQIKQRNPGNIAGLMVVVLLMFFGLYKSAVSSNSGRLGPRAAYWVVISSVMFQAMMVRAGMFGAAVLSSRPETMAFGGIFEFQFVIPFAACALLISLLIGPEVALIAGLMSAILAGFISPSGLGMSVFAIAGSITVIYSVQKYHTRNAVTYASLTLGAVNVGMGLVVIMISDHGWVTQKILGGIVLGIFGALLTAATAGFAIPVYESAFDILTDLKLMELSNADNPLLRQLAIITPGTNHHSYMVAALAEEAAKVIGANSMLARTGCLYHDIGKLAAPGMYIENQQGGPNPHDKVDPLDSVRIITGHVRRGIQMGREADLPPQIIDFIPQHHGTRVLAYFYHKAKSRAEVNDEHVDINDFRYPGPKPQTREAVILMLADGAEASVRSLEDPSPENISAIVKKIVDSVVADGQLDESSVTMSELTRIRESLINTLVNVHHQRISYPGFNPPAEAGNVRSKPAAGSDDAQAESDKSQAHAGGFR